jgi:hypothetical protein
MIIQVAIPKLIICMDLTAEPDKKAPACSVNFIQDILLFKGCRLCLMFLLKLNIEQGLTILEL